VSVIFLPILRNVGKRRGGRALVLFLNCGAAEHSKADEKMRSEIVTLDCLCYSLQQHG